MNDFIIKLRILARSEVTLFKADANRRANQAILASISIGCAFIAVLFVNMGLFFMLTDAEIDSRAAFILAAGNLGVALVPFLLRRNTKPSAEEVMVREIREMAAAEISKDLTEITEEIKAASDGIKQLRSGISTFMGGSGGGRALSILGPVLPLVIDLLKKGKN